MPIPLVAMAIGAGAGALLGRQKAIEQREQQRRQAMAEATKAMYSPWTGMQPGQIAAPDSVTGEMLSGGLSGAAMGANVSGAAAQDKSLPSAESSPASYDSGVNANSQGLNATQSVDPQLANMSPAQRRAYMDYLASNSSNNPYMGMKTGSY